MSRLLVLALSGALLSPAAHIEARAQSIPCSEMSEFCQSIVPTECATRLGAGAVAVEDGTGCPMVLRAYRQCLEKVAGSCQGANTAGAGAGVGVQGAQAPQQLYWGKHVVELQSCVVKDGKVGCRLTLTPAHDANFATYTEYFPILIGDGAPLEPVRYIFGAKDATGGLAASVKADAPPAPIRLTYAPSAAPQPGDPFTLTVFRNHYFEGVLQ